MWLTYLRCWLYSKSKGSLIELDYLAQLLMILAFGVVFFLILVVFPGIGKDFICKGMCATWGGGWWDFVGKFKNWLIGLAGICEC